MKVASIEKKRLLALIWQDWGILPADWALPLLSCLPCKKPAGISSQPPPPQPPAGAEPQLEWLGQGQQGSQAPPHGKVSRPVGEGGWGAKAAFPDPHIRTHARHLPTRPSLLQGRCTLALP